MTFESVKKIAEADFPTRWGAFRILGFEGQPVEPPACEEAPSGGKVEPEGLVALVMGDIHSAPPLVRIHSQCLTGDVFGSLRCDCRLQLEMALGQISEAGAGILLYEALRQTGAGAKIPAIAAKAAANLPDNLDLLIWLVDSALSRKANARDLGYAKRLIAVLSKNAKPESLSAADWERKRTTALGRAYTLAGCVQTDLGQYPDGDKSLRAALPLVSGNEALKAQVLYYLGVANFQFGTMTMNKALGVQAAKFSEQAADIPGPLRDAAYHNAQVMRQRATQMH